jgi:ribosome maturation protein Sdo1
MRRRMIVAMAVIGLAGLAALTVLRQYSTEIVNAVVANAVVQKAPDGYPAQRIRQAFEQALEQARRSGRKAEYLGELERLSQRLEKVQILEANEIDDMLEGLKP